MLIGIYYFLSAGIVRNITFAQGTVTPIRVCKTDDHMRWESQLGYFFLMHFKNW